MSELKLRPPNANPILCGAIRYMGKYGDVGRTKSGTYTGNGFMQIAAIGVKMVM
jgi:hypothetical protein